MADNGLPPVPYNAVMMSKQGIVTQLWAAFFRQLSNRVGGNASSSQTYQGQGSTSTADATTVLTVPIGTNENVELEVRVSARRMGGSSGSSGDGGAFVLRRYVKNISGTVSIPSQASFSDADNSFSDQGAWGVSLLASGGSVLVQVTGAANNLINWTAVATVIRET